jgi:hypothetical protein
MRWLAILACTLAILLASAPVHAQTRVELLGTWPAGDPVTLHNGQNFYLHLRYRSDQPVHIWVRPYFEGKPVKAGSNPSRTYPAGSGDALGWFFLFDPGAQVDEVQIKAGDGSLDRTPVVATFPVSVTSDDQPAQASTRPAWLTALNAADQTAARADHEKSMHPSASVGDTALFGGFMLAFVALGLIGVAWPAWALWRWRGGWRIAAAVPAIAMGFVILRIVVDTARDPTSHNLWPFEIVMWGGFSCLWMLAEGLARKLAGANRATT